MLVYFYCAIFSHLLTVTGPRRDVVVCLEAIREMQLYVRQIMW